MNSSISVVQRSWPGSVRFVVDETGQILASHDYSPFGVPRTGVSSAFGYAGEQWNNSAGLLYLRARYYDPIVGRFISRDPFPGFISLPATLHPYMYAFNNPVLYTDPSGRIVPLVVIFVAGGAILGGAIGGYAYAQTHRNVCGVQWNWDALLWIGGGALLGGAMGYGAWWLGGYVGLWSLGPIAAGGGSIAQQAATKGVAAQRMVERFGLKFTERYYAKLWQTGRGAPALVAREVLKAGHFKPIPVEVASRSGQQFFLYRALSGIGKAGWELVYNPTTGEVYHLQPVRDVISRVITMWR